MPSEPLVLGFDTSAAHCAAALVSGDQVIGHHVKEMSRGQAEYLMPMLEGLLAEAGKGWKDLNAIGVGIGPGNFTGIRISVSAARGLALALDIPAVGVSTFEATAFGHAAPWCVAVAAPRDRAYVQTSDPSSVPELIEGPVMSDMPTLSPPAAPVLVANIAHIAALKRAAPYVRPAPLYVRAADAAPPRDPAPKILP